MNMNNQPTEEELEEIENQFWIDQAEALARLEENKDFQLVILEGYFKHRALDQVGLLANEQIKRNNLRTELMESLIAISNLQDHFNTIKNLGANIKDEIEEAEAPDVEES